MNYYNDALQWANDLGDSGGAVAMRMALLGLYNFYWRYPIGEALTKLDYQGKELLLQCLREYAHGGETEELRQVGRAIYRSGEFDGWKKLLDLQNEIKSDW